MTIRTTDKTVSLALAIARDPAIVANAPKGSAKGQPGTFSDALACLPASVKAIGYTPAADVAPLPYDDEGAGHKAIMFSLDAIKTHLPEWEAKFRRMRGDQWRTVTINEQTFIINVHSRRPIEFRAVDPDKWGYSCAYHAPDSRKSAVAPTAGQTDAANKARTFSVAGETNPDEQAALRKTGREFWDGDCVKGPTPDAIKVKETTVVVHLDGEDFRRLRDLWSEQIGWEVDGSIAAPIVTFGDVAAQVLRNALEDETRSWADNLEHCVSEIEHAVSPLVIAPPDFASTARLLTLRNKLNEYFGKPRAHSRPGTLRLVPPVATKNEAG